MTATPIYEHNNPEGVINLQILVTLVLNAVALLVTAKLVPGFSVTDAQTALLAAIVLGVINTFIKPVLAFLTAPLTYVTFGLFAFVVNAIVLWLAAAVVPGIRIDSWVSAILAAIVLSVISTALSMLLKDFGKVVSKKR